MSDLDIKHGDTISIQRDKCATAESANCTASRGEDIIKQPQMQIRIMPDDNSCLFSAISYVIYQGDISLASEMRQLAASLILSNPIEYGEVVLGREPSAYVQWLLKPNSWGGAIELAVFSSHFAVEIASVDVATGRVDLFGEGRAYDRRVYLLYSGIHYDALVLSSDGSYGDQIRGPQSQVQVGEQAIFDSDDDSIMLQALNVAEMAKLEHRFTDLAQFTLRCSQCAQPLKGEREAERHAVETGHVDFIEYS